MQFESRLIPILRESVEVVKMILFLRFRDHLRQKSPHQDVVFHGRLAGAMVNEIFGTQNDREPFVSFVAENRALITGELAAVPANLPGLPIPLTDALRTQVICDFQEGEDNQQLLELANKRGLLLAKRDLPMPNSFVEMVRRLGSSFGIIVPPVPQEPLAGPSSH